MHKILALKPVKDQYFEKRGLTLMFFNCISACEKWLRNSWWMMLFVLGCYMFYERGLKQREQDFAKLSFQYATLQQEKKNAEALKEDLLMQINSQSDPAWVELTLMKGLGLVPEGQKKAIFANSSKE